MIKKSDLQNDPYDFDLLKRFEILRVEKDGEIFDRLVKPKTRLRFVTYEGLYDAIKEVHEEGMKHGCRDILNKKLQKMYANITVKQMQAFVDCCEVCQVKKGRMKKGVVVKPIVTSDVNRRAQVDCIDMQSNPDGDFRYIMVYQDHLTKWTVLRPLKTKRADEIAKNLVNIFCHFGSPLLLHSDNGREFVNEVIHSLLSLWPDCKMINGKARHSQSQGSVKRCNKDIENMLACWQTDNNSNNWAYGLQFVMFAKNARHHSGIGRSPFMAQMGYEAQLGVQTLNLDKNILDGVSTEEQLAEMMPASFEVASSSAAECAPVPEVSEAPASKELNTSFNNNELDEFAEIDDADFIIEGETSSVDQTVNSELPTVCISCGTSFTPSTYSNSLPCSICAGVCHAKCLVDNSCHLCKKSAEVAEERQGAKRKQQQQADKMLEHSAKRFKPAMVGDTVLVPIPDLDRGRC